MFAFRDHVPIGTLDENLKELKHFVDGLDSDREGDDTSPKPIKRPSELHKYVFDTETYSAKIHTIYMAAWSRFGDDETHVGHGRDALNPFWETIEGHAATRNPRTGRYDDKFFTPKQRHSKDYAKRLRPRDPPIVRIFAHNAQYDCGFLAMAGKKRGWEISKRLMNNGLVALKFEHKAFILGVELRCSYRVLSKPVAKLPETFDFTDKYPEKELMLHSAITESLIDEGGALSNAVALKTLEEAVDEFNGHEENVVARFPWPEWADRLAPYTDDNIVRFRDYVAHYCKRDVDIVKEALNRFDNLLDDLYKQEGTPPEFRKLATDAHSTSAISTSFLRQNGAFRHVYPQKGALKHFLRGFITGGRVSLPQRMGVDPTPFKVDGSDDPIELIDAVSLYPSAMSELAQPPRGIPKQLARNGIGAHSLLHWFEHNNWEAFFVVCEVKAKPKRTLAFGTRPVRSEDKPLFWTDDVLGEERVFFTHVSLPDYIEATKIDPCDIKIIEGIYYDEFTDSAQPEGKCGDLVQKLFAKRLQAKQAGNTALSEVIKLMLNSAYGRSILKDADTEERIYTGAENAMKSLSRNCGRARDAMPITDEPDPQDQTWSVSLDVKIAATRANDYAWGAIILDMSKRIMNRVLIAAEEAGVSEKLFYTDTDSIMLYKSAIAPIKEAYARLYPDLPPLEGKRLGQLHPDLPELNKQPTHGTKAIILGKKSYAVHIENASGDTGYKNSLKGVSENALKLAQHKLQTDLWGIYEHMYDGSSIDFENSAGGKQIFKYGGHKNMPSLNVRSEAKVARSVKFGVVEMAIAGSDATATVSKGVFSEEEIAHGCTMSRESYPLFKGVALHRVVWSRVHGDVPTGTSIDHINRVRTDARTANLRLANPSEQRLNQTRNWSRTA